MNPHTRDFRDTVRPGEKTGDPFQSFKPRRRNLNARDVYSTALTILVLLVVLFALPWEAGW